MPELNPTVTPTETAPVAEAPAPAAPKAPRPKAKSAAKAKPAPKKEKKGKKTDAKPSVGRAPKDGLRTPQIRILKYLNKVTNPVTRAVIAENAPVDVATCVEYIGSHDKAKREVNDKKHFLSLITLGLVRASIEEDTGVVYTITAKGKAAVAKV